MTSLNDRLARYQQSLPDKVYPEICGRLTRVVGLTLEAVGCPMTMGERCLIEVRGKRKVEAEVVGFAGQHVYLMPMASVEGLQPGSLVKPMTDVGKIAVGHGLLGRVLNGAGDPLDGLGPITADHYVDLYAEPVNPLHRAPIRKTLDVGIRAINALLSVGRGQRLGLFAGSGVGKSVLLGMMTRFTAADVTVVGLVGERGREVKEFIEDILAEEGLKRSVVVASPADDSPLMRLRAAVLTTRIAEYFRDQGKNVLLLMDSLTRFAQAQREIALAVGEPPATKGYPPSVFAKLPQLVERAGNGRSEQGSVTAFYTVLTEGDDQQDPIADAARAILDGHIVLTRQLAEAGHYPAIDVEASISRVMPQVTEPRHLQQAQLFKQLYSRYQQTRDLISVGAYVAGADRETDIAIERYPLMRKFLQQGLQEAAMLDASIADLAALFAPAAPLPTKSG